MSLVTFDEHVVQGCALLEVKLTQVGGMFEQKLEDIGVVTSVGVVAGEMQDGALEFIYHVSVCFTLVK